MPVWVNVLLVHGCQLDTGSQVLPLQLEPVGDSLHCTPTASGSMLPFNVAVRVGDAVTINWDSDISRYIVTVEKTAARRADAELPSDGPARALTATSRECEPSPPRKPRAP